MAVSPSPSPAPDPSPFKPDPDHSAPTPPPPADFSAPDNPNPNPATSVHQSFSPSPLSVPPPSAPSFRPSLPSNSPRSPIPGFHNPGLQPPGVAPVSAMLAHGAAGVSMPQMGLPGMYPNAGVPRPYSQLPAGYAAAPGQQPLPVPPPGIPRYPVPYAGIVRPPVFSPRPPGVPPFLRPPIPGIRGMPPVVAPVVRPQVTITTPAEKPQTTVYVGKIAPTVENDFLLNVLRLCGPVKSWKRAEDPSDGKPKSFAFCEFESAEGVLRAMRLLSKFNIDRQELVVNVNQATREYLERYVEKKTEREKMLKEAEAEGAKKEVENAPGVEMQDPSKPSSDTPKADVNDAVEEGSKDPQKFGIVTDDDHEADKDAMTKLTSMIEERAKNKPPPPAAQSSANVAAKSSNELPSKLKEGDLDVDVVRNGVVH